MSNYTVTIQETNNQVSITGEQNIIVETGVQGPPGIDGIGTALVSDSTPLTGQDGELLFNPTNKVLRVYANSDWQFQTMDDGFF